jgi:hypothetical protein
VTTITILDDGRATPVDAAVRDDQVRFDATGFADATGWQLKPEGLCRGEVCVPARSRPDVVVDGRVDAAAAADLLRRAVLVDSANGVVAFGDAASAVTSELAARHAADFTLPQLDGTPFTFSSIGRKKKLLFAWASW